MANKEVFLDQLDVEIDGVRLHSVEIPDGYVSAAFSAHVDNHHLVRSDELHDGMVVLLAVGRVDPDTEEENPRNGGYFRRLVRERSRWCVVTGVTENRAFVTFTGAYGDGTLIPRTYPKDAQWIVLKETPMTYYCPACGEVHDAKEDEDLLSATFSVRDIVQDALAAFSDYLGNCEEKETKLNKDVVEEPEVTTTVFNFSQPATLSTEEIDRITAKYVTYAAGDVQATKSVYEAMKSVKIQKRVDELEKNDLIDFGGEEYAVVSHSLNAFDDTVLRLSRTEGTSMIVPTFILPSDTLVEYRPAGGFRK